MPDPSRYVTPRGFTVYDEFTDTYGAVIKVQQSSSAHGPRCWIFASHPIPKLSDDEIELLASAGFRNLSELGAKLEPSPHLDIEQARRIRDALDVFIGEHENG